MLIGPSIFYVPDTALIALTACWEPSKSNKTNLRKSIHNPCPHCNYPVTKKRKLEKKERTKETLRQINVMWPFVISFVVGFCIYLVHFHTGRFRHNLILKENHSNAMCPLATSPGCLLFIVMKRPSVFAWCIMVAVWQFSVIKSTPTIEISKMYN